MLSVGEFRIVRNNETNEGEQVFVPYSHRSIRWPNGRTGPPKDEPECGFYGEKCPPKQEHGNFVFLFLPSLHYHHHHHNKVNLNKSLRSVPALPPNFAFVRDLEPSCYLACFSLQFLSSVLFAILRFVTATRFISFRIDLIINNIEVKPAWFIFTLFITFTKFKSATQLQSHASI